MEDKESKLSQETKNSLERRLFETYLILGEVSTYQSVTTSLYTLHYL